MSPRKPYVPPSAIPHDSDSRFPEWKRDIIRSLRSESERSSSSSFVANDDYVTVTDMERRYVHVSDGFCRLVGYEREALLGKRYDDLTAPETNDVFTIFNLFCQVEYMQGLWMLMAHSGTHILVRYEAWLRPDKLIEGHMQLVRAGY